MAPYLVGREALFDVSWEPGRLLFFVIKLDQVGTSFGPASKRYAPCLFTPGDVNSARPKVIVHSVHQSVLHLFEARVDTVFSFLDKIGVLLASKLPSSRHSSILHA